MKAKAVERQMIWKHMSMLWKAITWCEMSKTIQGTVAKKGNRPEPIGGPPTKLRTHLAVRSALVNRDPPLPEVGGSPIRWEAKDLQR